MSAVQRDTHLKERKCSAAIVRRAALCLVSFNFLVCCRKLRNLRVSLKVLAEGKRFTAAWRLLLSLSWPRTKKKQKLQQKKKLPLSAKGQTGRFDRKLISSYFHCHCSNFTKTAWTHFLLRAPHVSLCLLRTSQHCTNTVSIINMIINTKHSSGPANVTQRSGLFSKAFFPLKQTSSTNFVTPVTRPQVKSQDYLRSVRLFTAGWKSVVTRFLNIIQSFPINVNFETSTLGSVWCQWEASDTGKINTDYFWPVSQQDIQRERKHLDDCSKRGNCPQRLNEFVYQAVNLLISAGMF